MRILSTFISLYLISIPQTQVKAQARDYDRSQYRSSGRQSSGPDPRRSSHVPYGESDDRSREPTPRLPGTAPPVRRPRKLMKSGSPRIYSLYRQHLLLTSPTVLHCIYLPLLNKLCVLNFAFFPNPILSSRRRSYESMPEEEANFVGVKRVTWSRLMLTRLVEYGIFWYKPDS